MQTFTYILQDPMGLHARPAGLLVKAAAEYDCAVTLQTYAGKADGKRIMAVMRLAAKQGTELTVICEGKDEKAAAERLQKLLKENL